MLGKAYNWLHEHQLSPDFKACVLPCALILHLKKVPNEAFRANWICSGAEGEEEEGHVESCGI